MTCPSPETLSSAFDLALRADAIDNDSAKSISDHHEGRFQLTSRRYSRAVVENVISADGRGAFDLSEVCLLKESNQQLHREMEGLQTTIKPTAGHFSSFRWPLRADTVPVVLFYWNLSTERASLGRMSPMWR